MLKSVLLLLSLVSTQSIPQKGSIGRFDLDINAFQQDESIKLEYVKHPGLSSPVMSSLKADLLDEPFAFNFTCKAKKQALCEKAENGLKRAGRQIVNFIF